MTDFERFIDCAAKFCVFALIVLGTAWVVAQTIIFIIEKWML